MPKLHRVSEVVQFSHHARKKKAFRFNRRYSEHNFSSVSASARGIRTGTNAH
jgi:hypothetical protein